MSRRAVVIALVAGCYRPAASPGAPCPDGDCPSGQRCVAGTCRAEDDPGPDPDPDAAPDPDTAPSPDGPPDASGSWSMPVPIPGVNSAEDESDPSMTPDRLTIVFTSRRAGGLGEEDLYLGTRAAATDAFSVTALTALNSPERERSPEITADGATIFFTSNRDGNTDVYFSRWMGGAWAPPVLAAMLSSSSSDGDVAISPDGLTAMVARSGDLYLATRSSTSMPFGTPVELPVLDVTGDVAAPSLTNGAETVYLHAGSTRDLYVAYRQGTTFTAPVPIAELNTADRDAAPFISADGTRLLFEREGELYESTR